MVYILHGIPIVKRYIKSSKHSPVYVIALWLGGMMFTKVSETLFKKNILNLVSGANVMMLATA